MHLVLGLRVRTGLIWLKMVFRLELCEDYDDSLGLTKGTVFDNR